MKIMKLFVMAAAATVASAAVAAGSANATVEYSFLNGSAGFANIFSSPVTTSATVAPNVLFGSISGDVTYAASAMADTVSFSGHTYSFSPLAFSTAGYYSTTGGSQFSDLVLKNSPAAPEASDYMFLIAGLGAVGGYMAYRKRRGQVGPTFAAA